MLTACDHRSADRAKRRSGGARALGGLLLLVAAPAPSFAAGPPEIALVWNAPPGCPDAAAVTADVRRTLGGDPSRAATAVADVTELGANRWSVRLVTEVGGSKGERSFEAESCASVASATALILAWTIDPLRARAPLPPAASPPATAPVDAGNEAPAASRPAEPPPRSPSSVAPSKPRFLRGFLAVSGALDLGTLPRLGAGGEVMTGALVGPVRIEASGSAWGEQDATSSDAEGAHLQLYSALARACFRIEPVRTIELAPCLGGQIAYVVSQGFHEQQTSNRTTAWPALRADAVFAWTFAGPVALRFSGGVAAAAQTPTFAIVEQSGQNVVYHPASVAGRASLGLEVHFP